MCFDAGSGLSGVAGRLAGIRRLDILISHVHIDHILGLYNLSAMAVPEIHLYGEARRGVPFQSQLERAVGRPYWPIGLRGLPARLHVHELAPGERLHLPRAGCDGIEVTALRGCHPDGSLLYRADFGGTRVTYALDCEMTPPMFDRLKQFAQDSEILIWDATYIDQDRRPGWGHSTWSEGLQLGRAAGVGQVLMAHYSKDYPDAFLREQETLAQQEDGRSRFAREGMVICL